VRRAGDERTSAGSDPPDIATRYNLLSEEEEDKERM
jgi:hypothetical protein